MIHEIYMNEDGVYEVLSDEELLWLKDIWGKIRKERYGLWTNGDIPYSFHSMFPNMSILAGDQ